MSRFFSEHIFCRGIAGEIKLAQFIAAARLGISTSTGRTAVRENGGSRHQGGPVRGPLNLPVYDIGI